MAAVCGVDDLTLTNVFRVEMVAMFCLRCGVVGVALVGGGLGSGRGVVGVLGAGAGLYGGAAGDALGDGDVLAGVGVASRRGAGATGELAAATGDVSD